MRGNPEVIDYLNMLIGGELAARDQYLIHSRTPNMKRDDIVTGEDVVTCLKADLALEYHVREKLAQGVKLCEEKGDYVTRDMLRQQMNDTEEDHTYWLEKQLVSDDSKLVCELMIAIGKNWEI
ncbi:unnamed protein product [Oppiella nova]|uniref:Ferritin/DPS domain-containing protein n=1 Tax=Oppiella nova TaxID=334625 RepID=A0A7R9LAC8_9ACAR|nr:unnamed protein product [Oppiella nova]CAG2158129.1 unnamed protein product [Oppiella nova]